MNQNLLQRLSYSYLKQNDTHNLPNILKDSLRLISDFFLNNKTNKLCLVFPTKEFAAQWLSIPTVLFLIESEFEEYKDEIAQTYKQFKYEDKLMLNGKAIVNWAGIKENGITFKTKGVAESSGAEITIGFADVIKLQSVSKTRKLSSLKTVKEVLPTKIITAADKLLKINTYGNKEFIKRKICLVSKFKSFHDSIDNITINDALLSEYFEEGKINESGTADINSPMIISNNLSTLASFVTLSSTLISKIIIDSFALIQERRTDFSDIDAKNIPTILITDLSEIGIFDTIGDYGFEFFNFTKKNLPSEIILDHSPFQLLDKKIKKYVSFKLIKEICSNLELEIIIKKIHSIEKDEANSDLNTIIIQLVQVANFISRIITIPNEDEISNLIHKIETIELLFLKCRMWLGESLKVIEEVIFLLKSTIGKLSFAPLEKNIRLELLLKKNHYDYIICPTESEVKSLIQSLNPSIKSAKILSISNITDSLLKDKTTKAILTGWPKANNINKILSSFLFSELTVLFYDFENKYYNSLQKRNRKHNENIKSTISHAGTRILDNYKSFNGFDDQYFEDETPATDLNYTFDILDFEFKLDIIQYSKYSSKDGSVESTKAKRLDFENDLFTYSTESHKYLLINDLINKIDVKANIHRKKIEALKIGDVVALINTDRDILAELVEKHTNPKELATIKQWTELWKNLLKKYYASINHDFKKLVGDLRKFDCVKHEVTIKTWLQDESRIGPDDDADLISIALLTNSDLLNDNIKKVRESITQMKGLRHDASEFIINKIKSKIHEFVDKAIINTKIVIEGLGSVHVLKVIDISNTSETIDVRYVNKLLLKENL